MIVPPDDGVDAVHSRSIFVCPFAVAVRVGALGRVCASACELYPKIAMHASINAASARTCSARRAGAERLPDRRVRGMNRHTVSEGLVGRAFAIGLYSCLRFTRSVYQRDPITMDSRTRASLRRDCLVPALRRIGTSAISSGRTSSPKAYARPTLSAPAHFVAG